jgi:hypothetical protein
MTSTNLLPQTGQYNDLALKYINGDPDAIALLDIAIGSSLDLCTLRNDKDERLTNLFDYHDVRGEIDEAIDSIETYADKLGLRAPILDEADQRDLENGYGLDGI